MRHFVVLFIWLGISQAFGSHVEKRFPQIAKFMLNREVRTYANRADGGTKSDNVTDRKLETGWCVKAGKEAFLWFKPRLKYELDLNSINTQKSQIETTVNLLKSNSRIRRLMLRYYAGALTDEDDGKDELEYPIEKIYEQEKKLGEEDVFVDRFSLVNAIKPKDKFGTIKIIGSIEILEISQTNRSNQAALGCIAEIRSIDITQK